MRDEIRSIASRKLEEAQVVPLAFPYNHTHNYNVKPKGTTLPSLQPIFIDNNGTPATWTLISFQRVIDRQDRTLQSRRTLQLYWNYTGDITTAWYTGILHRTRTHRTSMTCLVGTPPLH